MPRVDHEEAGAEAPYVCVRERLQPELEERLLARTAEAHVDRLPHAAGPRRARPHTGQDFLLFGRRRLRVVTRCAGPR